MLRRCFGDAGKPRVDDVYVGGDMFPGFPQGALVGCTDARGIQNVNFFVMVRTRRPAHAVFL
jgi:hypothetical protein